MSVLRTLRAIRSEMQKILNNKNATASEFSTNERDFKGNFHLQNWILIIPINTACASL